MVRQEPAVPTTFDCQQRRLRPAGRGLGRGVAGHGRFQRHAGRLQSQDVRFRSQAGRFQVSTEGYGVPPDRSSVRTEGY